MVTDQEPRYRLVDADGNVVGSLFAESDGTLKLQEGTSGNDNELSLNTQGELEVKQLNINEVANQNADGYTIPDDGVVSFDLTEQTVVEIYGLLGGNAHQGLFISGFGYVETAAQKGMSNEGGSQLSGTTGPDGTLNFARDGNTGFLENRVGTEEQWIVVTRGGIP